MTEDSGILEKYIFVSYWTAQEDESIPQWDMYGRGGRGARIKLNSFPFLDLLPIYIKQGIVNFEGELKENHNRQIIPLEHLFNSNYTVLAQFQDPNLGELSAQVQYTKKIELLKPRCFNEQQANISLNIGNVGKFKHNRWEYQKEWRYRLFVVPLGLSEIELILLLLL